MPNVDEFSFWREAVAKSKGVETERGSPRLGYYRLKNEAVAFWRDDSKTIVCWRSDPKRPTPSKIEDIDDLFGFCAPHPISYELFQEFQKTGKWPDTVEPPEAPPADLAPDAAITAQIDELRARAVALKDATTQEEADRAANFAEEFAKLERAAEETREAEKKPHLEAGRQIDARWNPIKGRAADLKKWCKDRVTPFLVAERKRIAWEAARRAEEDERRKREAEEASKAAKMAGEPPPPAPLPELPPQPQKAVAGTAGRRMGLRKHKETTVVDPRAMLRWLAERNEDVPADILEALTSVAKRMSAAGVSAPGVETKEVEAAA